MRKFGLQFLSSISNVFGVGTKKIRLALFTLFLTTALLIDGCGPSTGPNEVTTHHVFQISVAYDRTISECRQENIARGIALVLDLWEQFFGMRSRAITITFADGDTFLVPQTINTSTGPSVINVPVTHQFAQGQNFAKTVAGRFDSLPWLWHLLCHINLIGANPLSGTDLADMSHTHPDWFIWDSAAVSVFHNNFCP